MNSNQEDIKESPGFLSSNAFVCLVAVFPVVMAGLLSTVIHASIPFSYIDADTEFASITTPPHSSAVQGPYTATGTIKKAQASDRRLFIVEESEGKYYPKISLENEPSHWSHDFYAGAPVGTQFRLTVISIDNKDHQTIIDWFKTGETSGRYPGISTLDSAEELTAVKLVIQ